MAFGYRLPRFPKKLSSTTRALSWELGVVWGGLLLAWITIAGHIDFKESNLEGDRELHRRHLQQLLEIHAAFRDQAESEGPRRFLTGYFSASEVAKDLRLACEGAIQAGFLDEAGLADCALVRRYLGDENPAAVLEVDGLEKWDYLEIAGRVVRNQSLSPNQLDWIRSYHAEANDWWSRYLLNQAGIELDEPLSGTGWYERSVSHGVPYFSFIAFTLFFAIPALIILFRRPVGPRVLATRRWDPALMLGATFWAVAIGQLGTGLAQGFVPAQFWEGENYAVTSNLFYLGMQGIPVLILALIFTPSWGSFSRLLGLNRLTCRHFVLILGLYGVYFLFNMGMWEIESRLGPYDTRDFLNPHLIDAGWSGLLSELVAAAVIAPIFEELTFRGFLYTALRNASYRWLLVTRFLAVLPIRSGKWVAPCFAALISTSIFAGLHFYSFSGIVSVAIFGLVMCWVYQKTRSLWPGILFHALFNLDATLSSWYLNSEKFGWLGIYG